MALGDHGGLLEPHPAPSVSMFITRVMQPIAIGLGTGISYIASDAITLIFSDHYSLQ